MFTATKDATPCIITAGSAALGRWCYTHNAPADSPANACAGPTLRDPWADGSAMVPTTNNVESPAYDAAFAGIIAHALATDALEHDHAGPAAWHLIWLRSGLRRSPAAEPHLIHARAYAMALRDHLFPGPEEN